jgi:K+-sensing histidine kinase KdpD
MNILIIENNFSGLGQLFGPMVKQEIGQVTVASTVEEAIGLLNGGAVSDSRFDLIVLGNDTSDKSLPLTISDLKKAAETIPVLVYSSVADAALETESVKSGAQDFLVHGQYDPVLVGTALQKAILRETQLQGAKKMSEEALNFLYRVSHDLKSPVNTMVGLISLATKEVNDPAINEYIEKLLLAAKKLENLIASLVELTISRKGEPRLEVVRLPELLEQVIDVCGLKNAGILLKTDLQVSDLKTDATILFYILKNILDNSYKYRRENVQLEVEFSLLENENNYFLNVRDNGQGLEPEMIDNVFRLFYRAHDKVEGTGVGLYNTRVFISKLKGEINVKTVPGKGIMINIRLPKLN